MLNNELISSTQFNKGVIVSPNRSDIIYDSIQKEYNEEIEKDLKLFFGDDATLLKAHILSSMLNLNPENKHIVLYHGSPLSGKTTRAKIASLIADGVYKTFSLEDVSQTIGDVLNYRLPIIDNMDSRKSVA